MEAKELEKQASSDCSSDCEYNLNELKEDSLFKKHKFELLSDSNEDEQEDIKRQLKMIKFKLNDLEKKLIYHSKRIEQINAFKIELIEREKLLKSE